MTKFLTLVQLVLQLFPALIQFVRQIEAVIPEGGQGAAKLDLIRTMLEKAFAAVGAIGVTWSEVWPVLQSMIDRLVALFNAAGTFRKTSSSALPVVSNDDPS